MNPAITVVGLGHTGLSVARYLTRCGIPFAVADTRAEPPGLAELQALSPAAPLQLGPLDAHSLSQAKTLVVSPGIAVATPAIVFAREQGVEVIGDIELFVRVAKAPIIAVTGTNGKSTVVTLLGEVFRQAGREVRVAGNIGTCVLDLLSDPVPDAYVLELSSFQLETTFSLHALVACILNVTPDHMDRYPDFMAYAAAKQRIYHNAHTIVFNADDPLTQPSTGIPSRSFTSFTPKAGQYGLVSSDDEWQLQQGERRLLSLAELRIAGRHNACNALCVAAIAETVGIDREAVCQALRTFPGLPHRLQWVAEIQGVNYFDDSKGTNVGASVQAIVGLGSVTAGKLILLAGGQGKSADFEDLLSPVNDHCRDVILFGEDAPIIASALRTSTAGIHFTTDLAAAVALAQQRAEPRDAVLLSPACASFDMFRNFQHRGECFQMAVRALGQRHE